MSGKIRLYIPLLLTALFMMGCSDSLENNIVMEPEATHSVTIELNNSVISRSAQSDNSEFAIKTLVVGLYPYVSDDDTQPVAWSTFTLDKSKETTVTLHLTDSESRALFNNTDGAKCRFFVVANLPDPDEVSSSSINDLRNIPVTSAFDTDDLQESFIMTSDGKDLLTYNLATDRASGNAMLYRAAAKINLKVTVPTSITVENGSLKGAWIASSTGITALLNNGVKSAVTDPEKVGETPWKPTYVEGEDDPYFTITFSSGEYKQRVLKEYQNSGDKKVYITEIPYYTYPNYWTESAEETHKTTLTLVVPWSNDNGQSWTYFYYQVPVVPADVTCIERNKSYTIELTLGILGELVPDVPLDIDDASYKVVSWMEAPIDITIQDFRYLVVNPNVFTFNNETNMAVPFYTSHPVEIVDVEIKYERFAFVSDPDNDDVGTVVTFTIGKDEIEATNEKDESTPICTISETELSGQKYINLYHPLNLWIPCNDESGEVSLTGYDSASDEKVSEVAKKIDYYKPTTDDAYSKYIITYTIRHKDNHDFKEKVTMYQYPAFYIEADRNYSTKPEGNIYVNTFTNKGSNADNGWFGTTYGLLGKDGDGSDVGNKNPCMYIITITQLSKESIFNVKDGDKDETGTNYNYVIGDPRQHKITLEVATNTNGESLPVTEKDQSVSTIANKSYYKSAPSLYGANPRKLSFYYPTLEDNSVVNMIAPKFRIASSWGVTSNISRNNARRRAAYYQEQQFPAGRWRMPTIAEFSYIIKLSVENKIPQLFTLDKYYWTAGGQCKGNNNGIVRSSAIDNQAMRAVYDEWYWKEYPGIDADGDGAYRYTLGDFPRGVQL